MKRYHTRPVEVEAYRFLIPSYPDRPGQPGYDATLPGVYWNGFLTMAPYVRTSDNLLPLSDGDWIVRYADGRFERYSSADFVAKFDPTEEP